MQSYFTRVAQFKEQLEVVEEEEEIVINILNGHLVLDGSETCSPGCCKACSEVPEEYS